MSLNDFLQNRNHINITTGQPGLHESPKSEPKLTDTGESFAEILAKASGVQFSGHAMRRLESRSIDITADAKLERLNKGVELAASKGSNDALVLIDSTAFVVSVKNNKVITTMSGTDLTGSVFTNIDSTIIM
jgi:flagellar operon protein